MMESEGNPMAILLRSLALEAGGEGRSPPALTAPSWDRHRKRLAHAGGIRAGGMLRPGKPSPCTAAPEGRLGPRLA